MAQWKLDVLEILTKDSGLDVQKTIQDEHELCANIDGPTLI